MSDQSFKGFVRASTGIEGLDYILGGGFPDQPDVPAGRRSGRGQDHDGLAVPARRAPRRGGRRLRHPLRDRGGAARRRRLPRLVARRHHHLRAADRRGEPEGRLAVHPLPPLGGRALGDHPGGARHRRAGEAAAGGLRLALRDAAAGPRLPALPAADPGAQALLHRPELHGAAARLHRLHHGRLPAPEPDPRRGLLRAARAGYGGQRRRVRVQKVRGVAFRDGYHDYRIATGGLAGLPAAGGGEQHRPTAPPGTVTSGLPSWTPCWAAASTAAPAPCSWGRPASASRP